MPLALSSEDLVIKAIVFDFDGVLVESLHIKTRAFARLFETEGQDVVRRVVEYHLANGGVSRFEKFRHIYRHFLKRELPEEVFDELCHRFSALVMEEVIEAEYVPGAKEFLDAHAATTPCYVASATPAAELVEIVRARHMDGYFKKIEGAPRSKADVTRDVMIREEATPDEVVFVGDALSDYEAACHAGVRFIGRTSPGTNVFEPIQCIKVPNLIHLHKLINTM